MSSLGLKLGYSKHLVLVTSETCSQPLWSNLWWIFWTHGISYLIFTTRHCHVEVSNLVCHIDSSEIVEQHAEFQFYKANLLGVFPLVILEGHYDPMVLLVPRNLELSKSSSTPQIHLSTLLTSILDLSCLRSLYQKM